MFLIWYKNNFEVRTSPMESRHWYSTLDCIHTPFVIDLATLNTRIHRDNVKRKPFITKFEPIHKTPLLWSVCRPLAVSRWYRHKTEDKNVPQIFIFKTQHFLKSFNEIMIDDDFIVSNSKNQNTTTRHFAQAYPQLLCASMMAVGIPGIQTRVRCGMFHSMECFCPLYTATW